MTLAALIDIIPEQDRQSAVIYRVKPLDRFDQFNGAIYVRKRYVVVKSNGYSICSCSQGQHLGLPCRHFFAVMNRFQSDVGFHISQIHPRWMLIHMRDNVSDRPWRYLQKPNMQVPPDEMLPLAVGQTLSINPLILTPRLAGQQQCFATPSQDPIKLDSSPILSPVASFNARFSSPKQSNKIDSKRQQYGMFMDTSKKLIQTIENSPQRFQTVLAAMNREIESVEQQQHYISSIRTGQCATSPNATPAKGGTLPADPIPILLRGRKRNSRIASSTEARDSKGRPRKMAKMNKGGINI